MKLYIELIHEFFPEIINVEFTAKMEQEFDEVEEGNVEWVKIIDDFYQGFEGLEKSGRRNGESGN